MGAVRRRDDLPRDDVGVVVEDGEHYQVAGPDVLSTPRVRDQVDGLGRAAGVDDLLGRCGVDESADLFAGGLIALGRLLGDVIRGSVDVRVEVFEVVHHRAGYLPRPLCRVGGIEIRDARLEDGEVLADRGDVEPASAVGAHSGTSTNTSSPSSVTAYVVAAMTAGRPVTFPVTRLNREPCCVHSTSMSQSWPSLRQSSSWVHWC